MDERMPVGVTLKEIIQETPSIETFVFDREIASRPGQFVMVWVPGVDEIPMALSSPVLDHRPGGGRRDRRPLCDARGRPDRDQGSVRERLCGSREDPCYRRQGRRLPAAAACRGRTSGLPSSSAAGRPELLFADRIREAATLMVATDDGTPVTTGS